MSRMTTPAVRAALGPAPAADPGALARAWLARGAGPARLAALIDPDRTAPRDAVRAAERAARAGFDLLLLGTSASRLGREDEVARALHRATALPLLLFPGGAHGLTPHADALLLLSLLSGRNPDYLVGEHVRAARRIRGLGIPAIPTAYLLIDGGRVSSVERVTGTPPLPAQEAELVADHVVAADLLGFRAVYLEAGSGAARPVPAAVVSAAREATRLPLLVGGGLRAPEACARAAEAGADTLVIGTLLEEGAGDGLLLEIAAAARAGREPA